MKTSMTFHGRMLLLWVGGCVWHFQKKAEPYSAPCIDPPRFLLPTTVHDVRALSDLSYKRLFSSHSFFFLWCWCLCPSLFSRVMSAFVTLAGRASSANRKLTNVRLVPAKTAPPAPTFSTATSRCSLAGGRRPRLRIRHLRNARESSDVPFLWRQR